MIQAGVYARISLDRQDGEGVERQLADGRALAASHGWQAVEFVDNDLSAYRAMRRPAWDALLQALRDRKLGAVVAYHPDRLYRRLTDLEDFIDAVQTAGAEVATVKAGDIDLSNASGRMMARILGSVSRHESERIGERVSRAKAERARQGRPSGGGRRPFGLTAKRDAVVPEEAAVVREVAERFLAGESSLAICRDLDARGITNTGGSTWTIAHIRRMVTSPYVAGLRSYRGEIIGEAAWPAILDVDTWQQCRSLAASRRRGRPPGPSRLLVGVLTCSICGRGLIANFARNGSGVYRCDPQPRTTQRGCGGIAISATKAEDHVTARASEWLADPHYRASLVEAMRTGAVHDHELRTEIDELQRRLGVIATMYADGELGDAEYRLARGGLHTRLSEAQARVTATPVTFDPAKITGSWDAMPTHERRVVLLAMFGRVPVKPGKADGRILSAAERIALPARA